MGSNGITDFIKNHKITLISIVIGLIIAVIVFLILYYSPGIGLKSDLIASGAWAICSWILVSGSLLIYYEVKKNKIKKQSINK